MRTYQTLCLLLTLLDRSLAVEHFLRRGPTAHHLTTCTGRFAGGLLGGTDRLAGKFTTLRRPQRLDVAGNLRLGRLSVLG